MTTDLLPLPGLTPAPLSGNRPLVLDQDGRFLQVAAGSIDLVLLQRDAYGGVTGERLHVARIPAGGVAFGITPPTGSDVVLQAVAALGTTVIEGDRQALETLAGDADGRAVLATHIDAWAAMLLHEGLDGMPPKGSQTLLAADQPTIEVAADSVLRTTRDLVWVSALPGVSWLGRDDRAPVAEALPFPLHAQAWMKTREATSISARTSAALLADGGLWTALDRFHRIQLQQLRLSLELSIKAREDRWGRKQAADAARFSAAVENLAGVLDPRPDAIPASGDEDPLLAVARLVGAALSLDIQAPSGRASPTVADIARASRLRNRRVGLEGAWWTQDSGPMIGFLAEGGRPVALLPAGPGVYDLADPKERTRARVTTRNAGTLAPFGEQLYRALPARAVNGWDLMRFGLTGSGRDLLGVVGMGMLAGIMAAVVPMATGVVFDSIIPTANISQLAFVCSALVAAAVGACAFQFVRAVSMLRLEGRMDYHLQAAVWDRLLSLPAPFFRDYTAGDLAGRAMGITAIRSALSGSAIGAILTGVFSIFSFLLLFHYDMRLAVVATVLVAVGAGISGLLSWLQISMQRRLSSIEGELSGTVLQFLTGIAKFRVSNTESRAFAVWSSKFGEGRTIENRIRRLANLVAVFTSVFPIIATTVIFVALVAQMQATAAAVQAQGGAAAAAQAATMSTGTFIAFNAAFGQFLGAGMGMIGAVVGVRPCLVYVSSSDSSYCR